MAARIPKELPRNVEAFNKIRPAFEAWLIEKGSSVKAPTNPYEVMRFVGEGIDCVIYCKANGTISSWENGAWTPMRAFLDQREWRAIPKGKRDRKTFNLIASLSSRDGWTCCYCPTVLDACTATIEHFVPITSGGTNHMANLSLACADCNKRAGHKPVREKLDMAVTRQMLGDRT